MYVMNVGNIWPLELVRNPKRNYFKLVFQKSLISELPTTFIAPKHWCCHSLKTYYTNSTITTTTDESGLSSKWAIRAQRVNAWQTSFRLA